MKTTNFHFTILDTHMMEGVRCEGLGRTEVRMRCAFVTMLGESYYFISTKSKI